MIDDFCKKCSKEDHEGFFCRCESRNVELAKERRLKNMSPWKKDIDARERANKNTVKE